MGRRPSRRNVPIDLFQDEILPDMPINDREKGDLLDELDECNKLLGIFKESKSLPEFMKLVMDRANEYTRRLEDVYDDIKDVKYAQGYIAHCRECFEVVPILEERVRELSAALSKFDEPTDS